MSVRGLLRGDRRTGGRKQGPNPLAVAAVTILIAVAITYWAFNGKQLPFVHHFTMYALVNNSVDIAPQSPVRIAGVDVGEVTGTTADGDLTKVAYTLQSNGLPIHTDATVTIRDRLFLEGAYYLSLDPGTAGAPIAPDGFTIKAPNTSYPVQFYQLLSTFDSATRSSLTSTLVTLDKALSPSGFTPQGQPTSTSGAAGLKSAIPQLAPTLRDVAWITQGLHGTEPGDVERLLSSASNVTSTLNGSSAQLADLVTSLDQTSTALNSTDGALGQSISGLDETLQAAPPALSAVDHALPPLTNLAVTLDPSLKAAPPILDGLNRAVTKLTAVLSPAERPRLLKVLRTTFEKFPSTLKQLGGAFKSTKGVTDCLRTHVTPILKDVVPDGSLSDGQPVWQDFAHTLVGLGGAVQDFDGNGYWLRLGGATDVGVSTGNLPGIGKVLALTPTTQGVLGARPQWAGPLNSSDFRPDVSCSTQPVPSLAAATAPTDFVRTNVKGTPLGVSQLGLLARGLGLRSSATDGSGR